MHLIPHTTEPLQTQNFVYDGYDLTLTTRFNSIWGIWQFDLFDNNEQEYITQSEAFAVSSPSLIQSRLPFIFIMLDDILNVYILEKDEYRAAIRA